MLGHWEYRLSLVSSLVHPSAVCESLSHHWHVVLCLCLNKRFICLFVTNSICGWLAPKQTWWKGLSEDSFPYGSQEAEKGGASDSTHFQDTASGACCFQPGLTSYCTFSHKLFDD